jgi:hypothetical protein
VLRLRVRLRRWRLDRELANGVAHAPSEARTLRAGQLVDVRTRRHLAQSLRRLVAGVQVPRPVAISSAVPACRGAVAPWCEALLGIAERLERPGPLNPRGVARALVLLTDGASPLFNSHSERTVGDAVWWVADGLQPCPPHAWSCPVTMKLDPERVAWTCERCGAIQTSDDRAIWPD